MWLPTVGFSPPLLCAMEQSTASHLLRKFSRSYYACWIVYPTLLWLVMPPSLSTIWYCFQGRDYKLFFQCFMLPTLTSRPAPVDGYSLMMHNRPG